MTGSSHILNLMKMDISSRGEVLAIDLFQMEPKYPRLMSYLFTKSNVAYGLSMLDKFQKSSTIASLSQSMSMRCITEESRRFKEKLVQSILMPNKQGLNILDYLTPCTMDGASWLRAAIWGCHLHGVTMPFIAEQFELRLAMSDEEISRSIIFRPDTTLPPRGWMNRGKRPLYIGSRTFVNYQPA